MVELTGYYKFSGFISSIREYLRLANRIAEQEPGEMTEEFINDLNAVAEEARAVAEFASHRYEEASTALASQ